MKNILIAFTLALTLFGCSSGDSSSPAPQNNGGTTLSNPTQNGTLTEEFDKDAFGNWLTKDCYSNPSDTTSTARILMTINGNGKASQAVITYASLDCSGTATPQQGQDFTYTIDRYANGGGQLTVNGNYVDVTINNGHLTTTTANGTREYIKQ